MLATLTREPFSHEDWIYERKLDGQRLLAYGDISEIRLFSRNRKENTDRYPEIADALRDIDVGPFILDGEVTAFAGNVSSFARLQSRMQTDDPEQARASGVDVFYYVFDVLYVGEYDVTRLPLRHRKAVLREAFSFKKPIRLTQYRSRRGEEYFLQACRKGWEGLIAKRAGASYQHTRSKDWLKFKCGKQQEFVIVGFTDPAGERIGFGALLIGFYEDGKLRYAGKVGTGYDEETLRRLHKKLTAIERKTTPLDDNVGSTSGIHWVKPQLVAEVGFTEWTRDNRLRHPRYLGLRDDKDPEDVSREEQPNQGGGA